MHFRIGSAFAALALAASMASVALAQAEGGTAPVDTVSANRLVTAPTTEQPGVASTLFLKLVSPADQDVEIPLATTQLRIEGITLPGAVVSVDGDLVDTDDQGRFLADTLLDEGANEIEVVASDDQGNQLNTSLFVTRGE